MLKKVKEKLKKVIFEKESPERLATAFSVGTLIAFSPTIGLHTASVFVVAYLFKLNLCAVFLGALINNPWTMVPIFGGCLWFGMLVTGQESIIMINWSKLTLTNSFTILKPFLFSFCVGTMIIGLVAAVISYFVMKKVIVVSREKHGTDDMKSANQSSTCH